MLFCDYSDSNLFGKQFQYNDTGLCKIPFMALLDTILLSTHWKENSVVVFFVFSHRGWTVMTQIWVTDRGAAVLSGYKYWNTKDYDIRVAMCLTSAQCP